MEMREFAVSPYRPLATPLSDETDQFLPARIGRSAAVTGHSKRPAGVGEAERLEPGLAAEPTPQEAGHEAIARSEHVEDLHGKPRRRETVIDTVRDVPFEQHGPDRTALANDGRIRTGSDGANCLHQVLGTARCTQFLLRADDKVA